MSLLEAAKGMTEVLGPGPSDYTLEQVWQRTEALRAAIAAAESAPALVTAEEILPVLLVPARARVHNDLHLAERAAAVAALVDERTAVAVAAARAEERERIAALVDAGWALLHDLAAHGATAQAFRAALDALGKEGA